jgi:hypothetical protein
VTGLEGTCSPEPATTACGDATDNECTNPDTCNGSGTCLPNHEASGFACGSALDDACTDPDTCNGSGTCQPNHAGAGAPCGDQGVECHIDDSCNGSGACTDNGFAGVGSACGSSSDTECTDPDTCTAGGTCAANDAVLGSPCGDQGVECVVDDTCNGTGSCTDNGFEMSGTACGSALDDECTNPDSCNGGGTCLANNEADGSPCGDQGVECHNDDSCSGGACTDAGLFAPGAACGDGSDTDCTNPDTCDVLGACLDNHETVGASCDNGTFCDGADTCNASGVCNSPGTPCAVPLICNEPGDACQTPNIWVNELHYDNIGSDAGEFIEVVVPVGTDISNISVDLYSDGTSVYGTHALSTFTQGSTVNGFVFYSKPIVGIQNGPTDGYALVVGTTPVTSVVQFQSYEGLMTATTGLANGLTSVDIGVSEDNLSTPTGASLGLTGTGNTAAQFTWAVIADDTPGAPNTGQTIN